MRCCRSDWPGLCLFYCYQPLCVVSQHNWFLYVSYIFQFFLTTQAKTCSTCHYTSIFAACLPLERDDKAEQQEQTMTEKKKVGEKGREEEKEGRERKGGEEEKWGWRRKCGWVGGGGQQHFCLRIVTFTLWLVHDMYYKFHKVLSRNSLCFSCIILQFKKKDWISREILDNYGHITGLFRTEVKHWLYMTL